MVKKIFISKDGKPTAIAAGQDLFDLAYVRKGGATVRRKGRLPMSEWRDINGDLLFAPPRKQEFYDWFNPYRQRIPKPPDSIWKPWRIEKITRPETLEAYHLKKLTPHELEVLLLAVAGFTFTELGRYFKACAQTVRVQLKMIREKMLAAERSEIVRMKLPHQALMRLRWKMEK